MKTVCSFILIFFFGAYGTKASFFSSIDTVGLPSRDTTFNIGHNILPKNIFSLHNLLLPATLITYGITSLGYEELKDINEEAQEELWIEHSHKLIHLDDYLQWMPAAGVYGLNAIGIKGEHNFCDRTIIYGLSTIIMSSTVYFSKKISRQLRPDAADYLSFPSGHTANAFAGAEFLRREYKDVSPWYGVAGYAVAFTTGYLRMYNNKHWLSDVVAGAGVGILSTDLAYFLYPKIKKFFVKEKSSSTMAIPFYYQGIIGLSFVHQF